MNNKRNFRYIGITSNLTKRIKMHNQGKTKSTRPHRPFNKIIKIGKVSNRVEARKLEKYYKSGIGREKLRQQYGA
jgi:putative endonuclease